MPLPLQTEAMEHDKFRLNSLGEPAVQTIVEGTVVAASQLVPEDYDSISLDYTNDDLTSVKYYKSGVLVAELSLTYTNGKLTGVSRL